MTTTPETKKRVLDAVAKWKPRLGLDSWAIRVDFDVDMDDGDVMQARPEAAYQTVTVRVVQDVEEREVGYWTVEKGVLHELLHCITSGHRPSLWDMLCKTSMRDDEAQIVYSVLAAQEEEQTTALCHVLWKAYESAPWTGD